MEDGEDVVKQVLDAEAEASEVALRRGGKVGAAALGVAIVAEPDGNARRAAVYQVEASDM